MKKKIFILIAVLISIALITTVVMIKHNNGEKAKVEERKWVEKKAKVDAEKKYENIVSVTKKMDTNFQIAKILSASVSRAWSNNLGNDFNSKINYLVQGFKDSESYKKIEKTDEDITNQSRSIINSNIDKDLKKAYTVLMETYIEYKNLAFDPKGNLGSYNAHAGELENSFASNYQNLKVYLPNKYIEKLEEKDDLEQATTFTSSDYTSDTQESSYLPEESTSEYDSTSNDEISTENSKIVNSPEDATKLVSDTYGDGGNLVFSLFGEGLETDEYGNYYLIAGSSLRAIEGGGNGSAGRYKVYEDGTIIEN